ncbi:molecular chaperone DnaJ [Cyanobium sp. Morenito 9A2]|uniref:molecular chaperone DnaJ n=1 Tax=Cyanobium sp. Morenito 9A2 TaxID=2823718 RepID=UPI0020CB7540|nr:molecular chaperone DnaJ [Cyanobium sp. Morenito 9A2]MCP9848940.1 molecular chaperone DnaJ [Cyanobium sp. Morenito 9A2]
MSPALVRLKPKPAADQASGTSSNDTRGFGGKPAKHSKAAGGKGRKRKGSGLTAADRSPLGKSPDLEAIEARHLLGLALAGRLSSDVVTQAWKRAAGEHHPDRGGQHHTMTAINGARDLLLGRRLD